MEALGSCSMTTYCWIRSKLQSVQQCELDRDSVSSTNLFPLTSKSFKIRIHQRIMPLKLTMPESEYKCYKLDMIGGHAPAMFREKPVFAALAVPPYTRYVARAAANNAPRASIRIETHRLRL